MSEGSAFGIGCILIGFGLSAGYSFGASFGWMAFFGVWVLWLTVWAFCELAADAAIRVRRAEAKIEKDSRNA